MNRVLTFSHITKTYPGVTALKDVSLSFEEGKVHALLGENGAGKSTLIKVLSGAITPDSGEVGIFGEIYSRLNPKLSQSLGIGVIYQEFNLVPQLSVAENIFLGHEFHNGFFVDKKKMVAAATRLLVELGVDLDPLAQVRSLSVAYMQIVEIAKAMSRDARILVLDEPTAPLTGNEVDALFSLIRSLRRRGVTMVYISHRMEELFEICDTVTVLRDGMLIDTLPMDGVDRKTLIDLMVGRRLLEEFPPKDYAVCEEVLAVEKLCSPRVRDISFTLCRGEILGIAGLVGAGRTELARLLFGADPISSGTIMLDGAVLVPRCPAHVIRQGIALVPEDRKRHGLLLELSVRHNISLPILHMLSRFLLIDQVVERKRVLEFIENLRIKTPGDGVRIKNLSGGNQQKAVIAKWLASRSKVLIFDEPTRGIDVGAKQEIYRLMHRLAAEGLGIIMISSEMPELLGMADHILVMRDGALAGQMDKEEATQEAILELAAGYHKEAI
jgi:ribose transport system ATP-binding protein